MWLANTVVSATVLVVVKILVDVLTGVVVAARKIPRHEQAEE